MKLTVLSIVFLTGTIMTAQAPTAAHAQAGTFAIEELSVADLEGAYLAGRTTARAVTQAHLDRIAAYDKRGPLVNSLIPSIRERLRRPIGLMPYSGRQVGRSAPCTAFQSSSKTTSTWSVCL
jgi:hypothetical protein